MKKIDNKGFTLIEILAAVTILGILSIMAIVSYSGYANKTLLKSREIFTTSSITAAEEYFLSNPNESKVTIKTLVDGEYLEAPSEKLLNKGIYKGIIKRELKDKDNDYVLDDYNYELYMCFEGRKDYYTYNTADDPRKIIPQSSCDENAFK